jgi:hypothetical protein
MHTTTLLLVSREQFFFPKNLKRFNGSRGFRQAATGAREWLALNARQVLPMPGLLKRNWPSLQDFAKTPVALFYG